MKELLQRENYEWMVKPTPQREWIESKGVFLWLAFFFSDSGTFSNSVNHSVSMRMVSAVDSWLFLHGLQ